ncbi:MAG TPA: FAD-dependent oxidoreductase [Candidatus Nanoarchaeia archaeon]|nr:FAD-dependent oxidoreductase [Candidatus Nanoarchaeia archaeon]
MTKLIDRAIPVSRNYWDRALEERLNFPKCETGGIKNVDVLIIGGGPAGLSAAHTLSKFDVNVVLLEGKNIGLSVGNSTGIIDGIDIGEYLFEEAVEKSGEKTKEMFRKTSTAFEGINKLIDEHNIQCERIKGGLIYFFKDDDLEFYSSINSLASTEYRKGVDYCILDKKEIKKLASSDYLQYGIWIKKGMVINPLVLVKNLAQVVKENGVEIYENSRVLRISGEENGVLAKTPNATIKAGKVIIATNPYTIDIEGLPKGIRGKIVPVFQTVAVSTQIPEDLLKFNFGWVIRGESYSGLEYPYGRIHSFNGKKKILVGTGEIQPAYTAQPKLVRKEADMIFEKLFPGKNVRTEEMFGGFIGQTPDREGLEGFVDENIFLCKIADGISGAVENGKKAALNILGLENVKTSPYRNGHLNTLYGSTPSFMKDLIVRVYLKIISL